MQWPWVIGHRSCGSWVNCVLGQNDDPFASLPRIPLAEKNCLILSSILGTIWRDGLWESRASSNFHLLCRGYASARSGSQLTYRTSAVYSM